jgi:hypothetical protein
MAYGNEIVLGFTYDKWPILEKELKLNIPRPRPGDPNGFEEYEEGFFEDLSEIDGLREYWENFDVHEIVEKLLTPHQAVLLKAWEISCEEMGWKLLEKAKKKKSFLPYMTPAGEREFSPWQLEFGYDPYNMEETPDQAIIGVAVSGRYFPTFLDWKDAHGGIWNFVFGPKPVQELEIARRNIIKAIPVFEAADWIIREKHY